MADVSVYSPDFVIEVIDHEVIRLNEVIRKEAQYLSDEFGRVAEIAASDWATAGKSMFWPGTTNDAHARLREAMAERNQLREARTWVAQIGVPTDG